MLSHVWGHTHTRTCTHTLPCAPTPIKALLTKQFGPFPKKPCHLQVTVPSVSYICLVIFARQTECGPRCDRDQETEFCISQGSGAGAPERQHAAALPSRPVPADPLTLAFPVTDTKVTVEAANACSVRVFKECRAGMPAARPRSAGPAVLRVL